MKIRCLAGKIDEKLLDWAGASDLWDELELSYIASPREDIASLFPEINIEIEYPDLDGWDNIDPTSYTATIWIKDEIKTRKRFVAAIKRMAKENKTTIENANRKSLNRLNSNDSEIEIFPIHAGVSASKKE
jgi:hypothetical protein